MDRPGHEQIKFFVGKEVEHTPAYGELTLFIVGVQSVESIDSALEKISSPIKHIYFGANQSFPNLSVDEHNQWRSWEEMILPFLKSGFLCTLDLDVR
jgi:hypothetical protein